MNGLYSILLFLFILGATAQCINEMHVFDIQVVDTGYQIPNGTVEHLQQGAVATPLNAFNVVMMLLAFMKVIGAGVLAMFWIAPIIGNYFTMVGADPTWAMVAATLIQAPLTFTTVFGLLEWWTGRQVT